MWHPENLFYARQGVRIDKGPLSRSIFLKNQLRCDGLTGIKENKYAAYCAIPLTQAPDELKPFLSKRQSIIMNILKEAGLEPYDPSTAPFSPDLGLDIKPDEIYRTDTGKVAGARFFTFLDLLPTTGGGIEERTALDYNRIAVVLHDKAIRTSRMQPNRTIHLQYNNLDKQREQLTEIFRFLQNFEPGMGFDNDGEPVLLGFKGNRAVNLEKETFKIFPEFKYRYDPNVSTLKLQSLNPELLQ